MKTLLSPLLIILIAVVFRLVPHPANVAPIAAMALFGGVYINKRYALTVPLLAMFFSDVFLGFHSTMPFVYGSFVIIGFLGMYLKSRKRIANVFAASFVSSLLFFIITNFGVWFVGGLYPKTVAGLLQCYIYALPFFRNTLVGDLLYTAVLFGSYEFLLTVLKRKAFAVK